MKIKIENTNTMTTTLTTSCKKRDTAVNRFCRFLSEYDSCFKDSLLIALMTIHFDCIVDESKQYKSVTETDEYYMTYTECGDVYQVVIEFKHDDNTTHYKSLANTSVSCSTKENGSETTNNEESDVATDSVETYKTPAELKAELNKKYGVNCVYFDTDSILCDNKKQNVYVVQRNTNDNITPQPCHIKAYYDGKELTIPYNDYKCRKYAVEYIHNLFKERVVPYETIFTLHYNTTAETITILTVIPTTDLIQYNIDDINDGLKNDSYKKVREGFKRLCNIITDKMKVCFDLHSGNNVYYYTIMKSRFEGLYTFKSDTMCRTQSPESFTRWLYYHTFTHSIDLKCLYRD